MKKRINLLDILIILVVIVCAAGAVLRFTGDESSFRSAGKTFDYVLKVEGVRLHSVKALQKAAGDNSALTDTSKETAVGNVYKVEYVPAREILEMADGTAKWVDVTDRFDAYVFVRAEGDITEHSYITKSGTEMLVNRENYYTNRWGGVYGFVYDIGENLSEQSYID